jgi:HrpA-like RNA helicase
LAASTLDCLEEACTVVAFLSVEHIFYNTNQDIFCKLETGKYGQEDSTLLNTSINNFNTNDGDHIRYVKIYRKYNSEKNKRDKVNIIYLNLSFFAN